MRFPSFLFLLPVLCLLCSTLSAQSIGELESRFKNSSSKQERMNIAYQLAEKMKRSNAGKAADYAWQANQLAIQIGDKRREAEAANLSAEATLATGNLRLAAERYVQAWNAARNYGLRDLALNSADRLQEIARRQQGLKEEARLKEELKWSREVVNYLKESGGGSRGGGDAQRRLENQLAAAEQKIRELAARLEQATGQSQSLETSYQTQLKEIQDKSQQQINQKEATITQIERARQAADSVAQTKTRMVDMLTKDQLADSIVRAQQERDIQLNRRLLAEAETQKTRDQALRNLLGVVVGFMLVLAGLFYVRYRAKQRTANELAEKNVRIEEEQKRSDNLLLNILPSAIAQELKTSNKVAARKYDEATVMFLDFKGFTNIAEQLSPELLVEELDFCFSNFDRIISQYHIEKIKTIGDAYLCASGLSDKIPRPSDVVKAALEIQDFLQYMKAERLSRGMPFFEARVGIHTGPVVAGVVGSKKFAYDIWGDTVNIAARMQESCDSGQVNVSGTTYSLTQYEFEWQSRGRIAAKNKGDLDMYYVKGVRTY
ncbi:MAG TPA: adenylate/guanylate cyclase domain-containing protein [Saprospiraceae bacterium]|nr:adenylate/guanylate cyclase domain-containing protein [Saprospiraceae bacterium]HND87854.1 adenylate/guanylate cyclase domain-containing protein [Saprospiraceae bacterium]